jgi:quercetin dioxygenase-like cupin family protein
MKKILLLTLVAFLSFADAQTKPKGASENKPNAISLKTGEPELIAYDAGTVRYLATAADTNGAWSLVELTEKPGYKTRLHRHIYTDEAYYVLEGVLTVQLGAKLYELPAGSYILIPHGTPHAQGNFGKVPVRVLLTMTPSGFEESFRDRAELIKTAKSDDPNFIKKREEMMTKRKYDREFLSDWNPEK